MFYKFTLFAITLLLGISIQAQKQIPQQIKRLEALQTEFITATLFSKSKADKLNISSEKLEGIEHFQLLNLAHEAINKTIQEKPQTLKVAIPYQDEVLILKLFKAEFTSASFQTITSSGKPAVQNNNQVHYRGIIENNYNSLVSISLFDHEITGFISSETFQYEIGVLKQNTNHTHIIFPTSEIKVSQHKCAAIYEKDSLPLFNHGTSNLRRSGNSDDCIKLYFEVDFDLYNQFAPNKLTNTQNYVNGVFAQVSTLLCNDGINVVLHKLKIWDTSDPYTSSDLETLYGQFRDHLNGNFDGMVAHLLGINGNGGLATIGSDNIFCRKTVNIGVSDIQTNYSIVPTYSWTIQVVTHELGHNFGSPHTHACVWNGNQTPIDDCGPTANFDEGCRGTLPAAGKGTIMSYCNLVPSVGINFNEGFGPQPTALIQNNLSNQNCVYSCVDGCDQNKITIEVTHKLDKNFLMAFAGIQEPQFIDGVNASSSSATNTIEYDFCIPNDCYRFQFRDYETVVIKDVNGNTLFNSVKDPAQIQSFADTWMCFPECTVGFTDKTNNITGTVYSNLATADFDQDGDLDIAVSGVTCNNFLNCAITEIYKNDGDANFTKMDIDMEGIWLGDMAWGKINNDNYLDLITIGGTNKGEPYVYYYNSTTQTFDKQLATGVTASLKATLDLGDVNGDGYDDMIVGGSNPSNSFLPSPTKLYINDQNGAFTALANTDFPEFVEGDIKFANLSGDQKLEIIISGGPSITNHPFAGAIYTDTGTGNLPEYKLTQELPLLSYSKISLGHLLPNISTVQAVLTGKPKGSNKVFMHFLGPGSFAVDTDNNGIPNYTDILYDSFWFNGTKGISSRIADFDFLGAGNIFTTGESANPLRSDFSRIYFLFNTQGSVVFPCSDLGQSFLDAINVGDYNGDNKIDIITTGGKIVTSGGINGNIGDPSTHVFINNYQGINLAPIAPLDLYYTFNYNPNLVVDSTNRLEWGVGSDDHTEVGQLTYNVRIGTAPGKDDILYPKAGADGKLHQLNLGNSNGTRELDLNNLKLQAGQTYYAAVQSIDLSYVGSTWSNEISFVFGEENSTQVIQPEKSELLKIYPNPTNGAFTLENLGSSKLTVKITNISGKRIKEWSISGKDKIRINSVGLAPGLYFAETNHGQRMRFIIY